VDGLAWDGEGLWVADSSNMSITQISVTGTVLRSFISPGQAPRGLAFDGRFLWHADGYQKIYQLKID
jgi:DNA-binding beta-propeller fold protein YncE